MAAGLIPPSLGHGHRGLGRDRQLDSIPALRHRAAGPGCRDCPKIGQALGGCSPAKRQPRGLVWDSLPEDRLPPPTALAMLLARLLATLLLQRPAVPCWQPDYKRAGPDQGLALEQCCAGSGSQFFAIMVYSKKLPLTLHEPPWLLAPALSACRLLFLSRQCFPGSTLLGFNGRKGGFTAPRV